MVPRTLLDILHVAERLKTNTRHCWMAGGRQESVAEHSWRLALMAMLVADEFPDADLEKLLSMCLIHDLGEAFTGDIPTFEKTQAHELVEKRQFDAWVSSLPQPYCEKWAELLAEMEAQQSLEARLYKALDKLEAVIEHNESDISTWLPLEYDLQLTYAQNAVAFSPYLQALHNAVNDDTRAKITEESSRDRQ